MAEVIYWIEGRAPRVRFAIGHILRRMLGWDAAEVLDLESFRSSALPRIQVGGPHLGGVYIEADPAMAAGAEAAEPAMPVDDHQVMRALFHLLARIEEQRPNDRDIHGRPTSRSLWVHRHGVHREPVADQWILQMAGRWRANVRGLPPIRRRYTQVVTMDVDNGFMYLGRPIWRTMGSATRDLMSGRWSKLGERRRVLAGTIRDPYDVLGDLREMTDGNADRVVINFLVAPRGRHDHAVGLGHPLMVQRMREAGTWAEVGVHPGYDSPDRPGQISAQRDRVAKVIGGPVTISRQHFLRMHWPGTLRELVQLGMREEHSMGLADDIGFRAGTCTPFPFYDVEREEETSLMIHPFAVMDSAMAYGQRTPPEEAAAAMRQVVDRVRQVQGTFIGIWHERFISDHGAERGWRRVAREVIQYARP